MMSIHTVAAGGGSILTFNAHAFAPGRRAQVRTRGLRVTAMVARSR